MDIIPLIHVAKASAEEAAKNPIDLLGLDWKLFIAQLVNFGIVILVLWKWVFVPAGKALEKRTEKIEKSLKDALDVEKQKMEFDQWKQNEIIGIKKQSAEILKSAQAEAEKTRTDQINETKKEQEAVIASAKAQLEREQDFAVKQARERIADLVVLASEKVLKTKMDSERDKKLITEIIRSL